MKKLLLLSIGTALSFGVFAQSAASIASFSNQGFTPNHHPVSKSGGRTTAVYHDSLILTNLGPTDTNTFVFPINQGSGTDSGFLFGNGLAGFTGFAERYDFNSADSSVEVLGVASIFVGQYNPATTHTVVFKAWTTAAPLVHSSTRTYTGLPNAVIDSTVVSYANLGIDNTGATDTLILRWFATPTSYLTSSFFVGFTTAYNWASMGGDTITVLESGQRLHPVYTVTSGDTTVNDQSAIFETGASASGWLDACFDLFTTPPTMEYYLFPIVTTHVTEGFKGVTRNDFTFYGNYPNPATSNTNIRFSLAHNTDVTIQIMDMNGRVVNTINNNNLSVGEHIINVNTSGMPAGDYVYLVRTATGNGIASKMTVIK